MKRYVAVTIDLMKRHVAATQGLMILSGLTLGATFLVASIVRGLDPASAIAGASVLIATVFVFQQR